MKQKEITICGQQVTLAYCYATEISYKILSGEDVTDFILESAPKIDNNRMPDIRNTIFLILAAMQAYYESKEMQAPITDKQLMYECTPQELGEALGVILGLRAQFMNIPIGEPEDKPQEDDGEEKNA
jgi:hypothetical protein